MDAVLTDRQECVNQTLLRALDRGIDDMEAGRELPVEDAFRAIQALRDERRDARV